MEQSINSKPTKDIELVSGKGELVYDAQGNEYIDLSCQTMNLLFGQCYEPINAAIMHQLSRLTFVDQDFKCSVYDTAIENLSKLIPSGFNVINLRLSDGSSAVECAIKMASNYRNGSKILTTEGIYLGQNNHTIKIRGWGNRRNEILKGLSQNLIMAPNPTPDYSCSIAQSPAENGQAIVELIEEHKNDLSCIILDPIMISEGIGTGRCHEKLIYAATKYAKQYDIPIILDECQTFGWVPSNTLTKHYGFEPDILILGKCLGGGLPLSTVLTTDKFDNLDWGDADYTNGGTLPAIAALNATCIELSKSVTKEHFKLLDMRLSCWCDKLQSKFPEKIKIHGIGLIRSICFLYKETKEVGARVAVSLNKKLLGQGIYIRTHRNCLTIKLSIITDLDKLDYALSAMYREIESHESIKITA